MRFTRRSLIASIVAIAALAGSPRLESKGGLPTDDASIVHALNRLTFGATVRDLEKVKGMGLARWIDQQLAPAAIDDGRMQARLAGFETLGLSSEVIAREYDRPAREERRRAQPGNADPATTSQPTEAQRKTRLVLSELSEAKLLRAVYSERQLEEVLVDFWFNHFNVFAGKGRTRVFITEYERAAIRPHVLGRFRDLLGATAKSPAMLFYLDNWRSGKRGLNENYARELLELHTLGVDGGYTQADIVNVARAFTGWSLRLRAPRYGGQVEEADGGFRFVAPMHDAGAKTVLGHAIKAGGGQEDGERVLDVLADHPSTARFIATKLARRFVSDDPPQALVDRAAARFRETKGSLREVVRAIVTSPELFANEARGAKVKTPLELVASALRATGADVDRATPLLRVLRDLGMPVYFCQPPTGYGDTAETWVSSGALVSRMNFAVDLASGRLRGVTVPAPRADLQAFREEVQRTLLFGRAGESTLSTIARATTAAQTLALAIGSPEFQRK